MIFPLVDPAPVSSSEDGAPLKETNEERDKDPAGGCENKEEGGDEGPERQQRSGSESGSNETTPVPSKDPVDDDNSSMKPSEEQLNDDKSEEEEGSNGHNRRRRTNGYESSSEEDSFADAVDGQLAIGICCRSHCKCGVFPWLRIRFHHHQVLFISLCLLEY